MKQKNLRPFLFFGALAFIACMQASHVNAQEKQGSIGLLLIPQITGLPNQQDRQTSLSQAIYDLTPNFAAGVKLGYQRKKFNYTINFLYSTQGQRYFVENDLDHTYYVRKKMLNYIKIPALINRNIYSFGKNTVRVGIGPEFSMLTGATERENGQKVTYDGTDLTVRKKYHWYNWGIMAHAGLDMKIIDKLYLNTGLRFDASLIDIEDKSVKWNPSGTGSVSFYDSYYGDGKAKTTPTHNIGVGFLVGITYVIDNKIDPNFYRW